MVGDRAHRVAIEASEDLGREPEAFLALGLLPAMKLGVPLRVPGRISARLLDGAERIQKIFRLWIEGLRVVEIEADRRRRQGRSDGRVGAFFSGGVDSFYTALKHREQITDLIFVHGFDIPLSGREELRRQASEMARAVADALGKHLIEVNADVRSFTDRYVSWDYSHGPALAAIALLLQQRFRVVLTSSSMSYANLYRWGSHPLVDPLWSTERTEVVSTGQEAPRPEKVAFIADSETAMRWLRVCWRNPGGAYNCGRCEKCLRTMISLRAAGAQGRCRTLPDHLDLGQVRRMALIGDPPHVFARENLIALESRRGDPKLARALEVALNPGRPRLLRAAVADRARRVTPDSVRRAYRATRARFRARARR